MNASEPDVADIFGDFDDDMGDAESSMVDSLKVAGVVPKKSTESQKDTAADIN